MVEYSKDTLELLIDGELSWEESKAMMSNFKDPNRFDKMIEIFQDRVPWEERILLPYSPYLFIVQKEDDSRVMKCRCGFEFGDYRVNWKMQALIYLRDSDEKLQEIYPPLMHTDPGFTVLREYYCPGCKTQLEVEVAPPGYPIIFDFEPDLDVFYREWLGREP